MNLSVLVSVGQRPAPRVLADFCRSLVRWADLMPLLAWNLLNCMLAATIACQILFFGQAAAKSMAMDLAMPTGLASTRAGRRGTSGGSPDPSLPCGSYSRYSSDMQRDESISDQQRTCHQKAATNEHTILSEFEFYDEAVSGTKLHRTGLDAMLAAAEAGKFKVLYFHSLSRLARESVISLPILKHLVYNLGVLRDLRDGRHRQRQYRVGVDRPHYVDCPRAVRARPGRQRISRAGRHSAVQSVRRRLLLRIHVGSHPGKRTGPPGT